MGKIPDQPNPLILERFLEPSSMTKVWKKGCWGREVIWRHLKAARRLGLIHKVGSLANWGPPQLLYELTPEGLKWLEENKV